MRTTAWGSVALFLIGAWLVIQGLELIQFAYDINRLQYMEAGETSQVTGTVLRTGDLPWIGIDQVDVPTHGFAAVPSNPIDTRVGQPRTLVLNPDMPNVALYKSVVGDINPYSYYIAGSGGGFIGIVSITLAVRMGTKFLRETTEEQPFLRPSNYRHGG